MERSALETSFPCQGLRRVLGSASWLLLAGILSSCRSDNLGFTAVEVRDGSTGVGNHVSRLEREWRANEPGSYR